MRIVKDSVIDNYKAEIKRLIEENLNLKGEIYNLKRQLNFERFAKADLKGIVFPNTEEGKGAVVYGEPETPDFSDF